MDLDELEEHKIAFYTLKNNGCTFEDCLAQCGLASVEEEERENLQFAFDHVFNWGEVEKKFKKGKSVVKPEIPIPVSKKTGSTDTVMNSSINPAEIVKNGSIFIEVLTKEAYGKKEYLSRMFQFHNSNFNFRGIFKRKMGISFP